MAKKKEPKQPKAPKYVPDPRYMKLHDLEDRTPEEQERFIAGFAGGPIGTVMPRPKQ